MFMDYGMLEWLKASSSYGFATVTVNKPGLDRLAHSNEPQHSELVELMTNILEVVDDGGKSEN